MSKNKKSKAKTKATATSAWPWRAAALLAATLAAALAAGSLVPRLGPPRTLDTPLTLACATDQRTAASLHSWWCTSLRLTSPSPARHPFNQCAVVGAGARWCTTRYRLQQSMCYVDSANERLHCSPKMDQVRRRRLCSFIYCFCFLFLFVCLFVCLFFVCFFF